VKIERGKNLMPFFLNLGYVKILETPLSYVYI